MRRREKKKNPGINRGARSASMKGTEIIEEKEEQEREEHLSPRRHSIAYGLGSGKGRGRRPRNHEKSGHVQEYEVNDVKTEKELGRVKRLASVPTYTTEKKFDSSEEGLQY